MRIFIHEGSLCFEPEVDSGITWLYATLEMFKNQNFRFDGHSITRREAQESGQLSLLETLEKVSLMNKEHTRSRFIS